MCSGKTVISEDVFIDLAKNALTKETELSVQEKKSTFTELFQMFTERFAPQVSVKKNDGQILEEVSNTVSFELKLILVYGVNIPEAVTKIREAISQEVQAYTGYTVEKIDVVVEKLVKPDKKQ